MRKAEPGKGDHWSISGRILAVTVLTAVLAGTANGFEYVAYLWGVLDGAGNDMLYFGGIDGPARATAAYFYSPTTPDIAVGDANGELTLFVRDQMFPGSLRWTMAWKDCLAEHWPIEMGTNAAPAFDDALNLFLGQHDGKLGSYGYLGLSLSLPRFDYIGYLRDGSARTIDVGYDAAPGHGTMGLFVGNSDGTVDLFRSGSRHELWTHWFPGTSQLSNFPNVDVGTHAVPYPKDIDADGFDELFIGTGGGTIWLVAYTPYTSPPVWPPMYFVTSTYASIDVGGMASPVVNDMDNDGDPDMLVANWDGEVRYYENIGTAASASWASPVRYVLGLDMGWNSAPAAADLDLDGDYDLIIGEADGTLNFLKNDGSMMLEDWDLPVENYAGVKEYADAKPALGDLDADGDNDLVVGNSQGTLTYVRNVGTPYAPAWATPVSNWSGIDVGHHAAPALADMDGDGDLDMLVGTVEGTVTYFRNDGTLWQPFWAAPVPDWINYDIGSRVTPAIGDVDYDGDLDLFLGEADGILNFVENTGTRYSPTWAVPEAFAGTPYGANTAPHFTSLDGDGRLDLLVGEHGGGINFLLDTDPVPVTPSITVGWPNGGETLQGGLTYPIRWTCVGDVGTTVAVSYSLDNGGTWTPLAGTAPNAGTYLWTVPETMSNQALVRVASVSEPTAQDTSDSVFGIVAPLALRVTGMSWSNGGRNVTISYEANKPVQSYYVRLYQRTTTYTRTGGNAVSFGSLNTGYYLFVATARGADGQMARYPLRAWFYNKVWGTDFEIYVQSISIQQGSDVTVALGSTEPAMSYYTKLWPLETTYSYSTTPVAHYTGLPEGLYYFVATGRHQNTLQFPPGGPARQFIVTKQYGFP